MNKTMILVAGGGPAGLAAACLAAQEGLAVTLATAARAPDARTVALMQPSLQMLRYLDIWPGEISRVSAPLKRLHIIDDTGHLVTAPSLEFSASELGLEEFGWNVPVADLVASLLARAAALNVKIIESPVVDVHTASGQAVVTLQDGSSFPVAVVVAADGVNSPVRKMAGIDVDVQSFAQTALATSFNHSAPHQFVSTEQHKQGGPFTTVPLPGNWSSLVWMGKPADIARLASLPDDELAAEIQLASHGRLGLVSSTGPRSSFAMKAQRAKVFAANRVMLVGEAAHAMPPLGAQGLNMSLRDAGHAVDCILAADDPGSDATLEDYHTLRRADVETRMSIVKLMNGSLLTDFAPANLLRAAGLAAVAHFPPLRKLALHQGLAETSPLPFAMRAPASTAPAGGFVREPK